MFHSIFAYIIQKQCMEYLAFAYISETNGTLTKLLNIANKLGCIGHLPLILLYG